MDPSKKGHISKLFSTEFSVNFIVPFMRNSQTFQSGNAIREIKKYCSYVEILTHLFVASYDNSYVDY